jgi:hypothetical protein
LKTCRVCACQWHALQPTYNGGGARGACKDHSIGRWEIDAFSNVEAAISEQALPKFTAYNVLKFLADLNKVFLQDAATIMTKHPERACNPLFRLEVFQTADFQVSFWLQQFWGRIFTVFTNSCLFSSCLKIKSH